DQSKRKLKAPRGSWFAPRSRGSVHAIDGDGGDRHVYMQTAGIRCTADVTTRDRERLLGAAGCAHANQVRPGDQHVRRVVFDPAGPRKRDPDPGMGAAPAPSRAGRVAVQVAGDEAGGEAEAALRLHHEHGKVAARAGTEFYCLGSRLRAFRETLAVAEFLFNG